MDKIQIGENAGVLWRLMAAQQNNHVWDLEKLQEASGHLYNALNGIESTGKALGLNSYPIFRHFEPVGLPVLP